MLDIYYYTTENNRCPFIEWLDVLDNKSKERVYSRINRLKAGNFGDCKSLGSGISELRFHFGGGYRVYFGKKGKQIIILLCAGDKSSQSKDIETAIKYWKDC